MIHRSVDIIGHVDQRNALEQDIAHSNVAHAYLFAGPRHIGKLTIAHWFAKQLLLKGVEGDTAEVEHHIQNLTHSDLLVLDKLWIEKASDDWDDIAKYSNVSQQHRSKKPPAKTDVISIDDIRSLQDRLHDTGLGTHRVCIIRSIERMKDEAANAFLKILEEPPPGLVFILTTQSSGGILPTIISRTRVLNFARLPNTEIVHALSDAPDDDARFIVGLAQGAPGIAFELLHNPDALREQKQVHAQAHAFWKSSSIRERIKLLKPLETRGEDADTLLLHLMLTLREQRSQSALGALITLIRELKSNAHRQLLLQKFILSLS